MLEKSYVSKATAALARRLEDWLVTTSFVQFASIRVLPGREPEFDVFVGAKRPAPESSLAEALKVLIHNQLLEWDVEDGRYTISVRARQGVAESAPGPEPQVPELGCVS